MKFDKKMKKIVEKSSEELKQKNDAFFMEMLNAYDEREILNNQINKPVVNQKTPIWRNFRVIGALCCSLILVVAVLIAAGVFGDKIKNQNTLDVGSGSQIESNSTVTEQNPDFKFNFIDEHLAKTKISNYFSYAEHMFCFDDYQVGEMIVMNDEQTSQTISYYVLGSGSSVWFQTLLIVDPNYEYVSRTNAESQQITIEEIDFRYTQNQESGMTYFIIESNTEDQRLVIEFMTTNASAQTALQEFLHAIIS